MLFTIHFMRNIFACHYCYVESWSGKKTNKREETKRKKENHIESVLQVASHNFRLNCVRVRFFLIHFVRTTIRHCDNRFLLSFDEWKEN